MAHTCAHHDCKCEVEPEQRYCGDYCKEAAEASAAAEAFGMSVCRCNHEPCIRKELRGAGKA